MSARDYLDKDFYAVLGVTKTASADEMMKAYRKLARLFHPDANGGDPEAEERFKEISEAYDVLSDDTKRGEYDEMRQYGGSFAGGQPGGFGAGGATTVNLGDLFGGLFSGHPGARRATKGEDLPGRVSLSFRDASSGVTTSVQLRAEAACPTCGGTGAKPGTTPHTCSACGGSGQTVRQQGGFGFAEPCRACRGRGQVVDAPCGSCAGVGATMQTRTINVRVPSGIKDGATLRVPGKGAPGRGGAPAGDLLVTVQVSAHPVFGRKGQHLTLTVPVTFVEAALGATITVPTLDAENVSLKVPAGTPSGRTFRVKGRGLEVKDKRGDLLVTVDVAVPLRVDGRARKALDDYAEATASDDPRADLIALAGRE
ncbi:MAG: molecular chaperone DnaJ [Actinomycetia bacterium]|nr:molecular chaperone DnaJ [Actinomycetes bacterium]